MESFSERINEYDSEKKKILSPMKYVEIVMSQAEEEILPGFVASNKKKKEKVIDVNSVGSICKALEELQKIHLMVKTSIKGISFNTKGLTDPLRAVQIRNWLFCNSFSFDFLCLQEIKCSGSLIQNNRRRIGANFSWFVSTHNNGKGGTTISISKNLTQYVTNRFFHDNWVGLHWGGILTSVLYL